MPIKAHHHVLELPVIKLLQKVVQQENYAAYVIGGFVRDSLLGRAGKDLDIVTLGDGIALAHAVANEIGNTKVTVFKTFGTAMLRYKEWELEFVGARKESYSPDSRKPSVTKGSLRDDQLRRDFTINALAISISPETYGELIDPFNGLDDLKHKIIRTPTDPEITYSDDPLRMMRAIRFASQLNFTIEPVSLAAIKNMHERIEIVSAERITDELNKII